MMADALAKCNSSLIELMSELTACNCDPHDDHGHHDHHDHDHRRMLHAVHHNEDCTTDPVVDYAFGLHIAAIFIVAACSSLGAALPLLAKRGIDRSWVRYAIFSGKNFGIGIVLALALIHMLQPAAAVLTDHCVPVSFSEGYPGFAYLFALIAALAMHSFEMGMSAWGTSMIEAQEAKIVEEAQAAGNPVEPTDGGSAFHHEIPNCHSHSVNKLDVLAKRMSWERMLQAIMLEFAFSVHSIFIGLTVGIVSKEFDALLIALVFHQFFEGISLGARLLDAEFKSKCTNVAFVAIFALSAPVGIMIGVIAVHTINLASVTYLLVQGIFDGLCSGILLYVGFGMLLVDFPREMASITEGKANATQLRVGGIFAIWLGGALMAVLGLVL